jgi:hypothetical protein
MASEAARFTASRWDVLVIPTLAAAFAVVTACGNSPSSPSPPSSSQQPPAPRVALSGTVTATVTGQPLQGVVVDANQQQATTDVAGKFRIEWEGAVSQPLVTIEGPNVLKRSLWVSVASSRDVALDAIDLTSGFELEHYRRLVRNTFEEPESPRVVRRWTRAPLIYLKTVDEAGLPLDQVTLDTVAAALLDGADAWTGGRFGIAGIERGPESREGVSGWITVKWPNPADEGICGRAQVAADGGWIQLFYQNRCSCGPSRMSPAVVRHEFGHAMGFWHTGESGDLMLGQLPISQFCTARASARERFHAAIAYSRPNGNIDPDADPGSQIFVHPGPPVVIDD